jgi:hypothetical protein
VLPLLWVLLVVPTVLLAGPASATVARPVDASTTRAVEVAAESAPPLAFWLTAAAVVAVIVAGAVALGAQGDPQPPRQGSVLKALERRSDSHAPPEDNS